MAESWKIHLVAVTSNGRRAYFTTSPYMRGGYGEERDLAKVRARVTLIVWVPGVAAVPVCGVTQLVAGLMKGHVGV